MKSAGVLRVKVVLKVSPQECPYSMSDSGKRFCQVNTRGSKFVPKAYDSVEVKVPSI